MKILICMQGYFPAKTYGGPPVSITNFSGLLLPENECFIVANNHELFYKKKLEGIKDGWNNVGNANVLYLSDEERNFEKYTKIVNEVKPDLVYLNSLFDAKNVILFLYIAKKHNINVLLAPRGELCKGAFRKKYKKIPYLLLLRISGLIKNIYFQSTSEEEKENIRKYLCVSEGRIFELTNIPTIPLKKYEHPYKEKGSAKLIFLSRIHPKKNLLKALSFLNDVRGTVEFDIYGPIENESYWEECQKEIACLNDNINVTYCGLVNHENINEIFSMYHTFLFPTFSENYGHVIAESLFAGTPVIISDQTPWVDVEINNCGWSISLENTALFQKMIQKVVDLDNESFLSMSESAMKYINNKSDIEKIKNEYVNMLRKIEKM